MSFFTSLTGLKAANTELAVTSNNIANAGTTGFKNLKLHLVIYLRALRSKPPALVRV